jgi:hypothetical protein
LLIFGRRRNPAKLISLLEDQQINKSPDQQIPRRRISTEKACFWLNLGGACFSAAPDSP